MDTVQLKTNELDGKLIAYHTATEFWIQCSKSACPKSAYVTRRVIVGNLAQAVMHYNMLNVGNGYRKRLLMSGANKPVLARQAS